MLVLSGPDSGHFVDTMCWRDSSVKHDLEIIMDNREANGQRRLKVYADKLYNDSPLVTAAYSKRHGVVHGWMTGINLIMSKVRVAVEWNFGLLVARFKHADFAKGLKIQDGEVVKTFRVAALLANCHTCLYGSQHTTYFDIMPPTVEEYLDQ